MTSTNAFPPQRGFSEISRVRLWSGRILSVLAALFFLMDGGMKLFKPAVVVEATLKLGYPESTIVGIGICLIAVTVLYMIPRTSVLGAVLLTAYLGGAVASQVRVTSWSNVPFPVFFGCILWLGLWLRNRRLEQLLPLTSGH